MRKYIYSYRYVQKLGRTVGVKEKRGVLVAKVENGQVIFGCSYLCEGDRRETLEYNRRVKRVNQESWALHIQNGGDNTVKPDGVETLKPLFDKNEAVRIASEKATNVLKISDLPKTIREQHLEETILFVSEVARRNNAQITISA